MNEKMLNGIVAVSIAIIGVASLAVLLSSSANTSNFLTTLSKGIAGFLCTAMSPITGDDCRTLTEDVRSTIHW